MLCGMWGEVEEHAGAVCDPVMEAFRWKCRINMKWIFANSQGIWYIKIETVPVGMQ